MEVAMLSATLQAFAATLVIVAADPPPNADGSALKRIKKLGGIVTRDPERTGRPVIGIDLGGEPAVKDMSLEGLEEFTTLTGVGLACTGVTDAGLVRLGGLCRLRSLDLGQTAVTDAGLVRVGRLYALQYLNLADTKVTDAGLTHLRRLAQLRVLILRRTAVTDVGLGRLKLALPRVHVWR
jgi:hypothetical protein